ncbi:ANTAR domain-containing protein [Kribbella antibiotica]|uniref:ANTAR domain-containing protein n=1 Tax=Kribbella antibiotica TaxID=190195 RepID=A0A4R4ZP06_9ACTN|nr:GAF and ANTAR domain-containing protein [Kribbella antibiotica]TDD60638.1 ANTAR domain-containing protein [Kribbella antibiotica]
MPQDHSSAEAFGRLATELQDADGVDLTVEAVVQFALQAVWCTYASVVLVGRGRKPQIMALTDPRLAKLDETQIQAADGPLLTVIRDQAALLIPDIAADRRWPGAWADALIGEGIRSAIHLPLLVGGSARAVLSLYSGEPNGFDTDDLAVAHILADHAAVAIAGARREVDLAHAADARNLVGQAIGILMERYDLDNARAFAVLKRYSQDNNRKLRDVAQELIDTRKLSNRPIRTDQGPAARDA